MDTRALAVSAAFAGLTVTAAVACSGDTTPPITATFSLSIPGSATNVLAATYTCDGSGYSPALQWSGAPAQAMSFAVVMSTLPVSGGAKYNWLLYDIPSTTSALPENASDAGTFGNSDDGGGLAYAPPCSPSIGTKDYTITVFALSAAPDFVGVPATQVTGAALTAAIAPLTLASASITQSHTRTQAQISCVQVRQSIVAYQEENALSLTCDDTYASFNTFGIQTAHPMMNGITATNQQVPVAQNFTGANAWRIPLVPDVATQKTSANDGPIGVAVNGVPIFNPCKQGGCNPATGGGDTKVLGELDLCNGHAGRADDYHYHAAPTCMMADEPEDFWDTHPVGWALDGYAIFGYRNPDGTTATRDGQCGGNTLSHPNAPSGYAYHVTDESPYVLSCFYGTPSPDLAGQGAKFSPLRPPGEPMPASAMTLDATAASLAIGGTTTMQWTSAGSMYQVVYRRTSALCWNFVFRTNGAQTGTSDYCRAF